MRTELIAFLALLALPGCGRLESPTQSTALRPLEVTLITTVVRRDLVRLVWSVSGDDGREFEVLRQNRIEPWKHFSNVAPAAGAITVEDTGVVPGQSYGYRLKLRGAPRDVFLDEVQIDVPR